MAPNSRITVFISFSGLRSRKIAELLAELIANHLSRLRVFLYGPESGSRHLEDLGGELDVLSYAILCLTPENMHAPWIHFEAGAISKHRASARIVPLTFSLAPEALHMPLAQFGARSAAPTDITQLLVDMARDFGQEQPDPVAVEADWQTMLVQNAPELREPSELVDENNPIHNRIRKYCRTVSSRSTSLRRYLAREILKRTHDALKELGDQLTRIRTPEEFIFEVADALRDAESVEALCGGKPWGTELRSKYYESCYRFASRRSSKLKSRAPVMVRMFCAPQSGKWSDDDWFVLKEHHKRRRSGVRPLVLQLDVDGRVPQVPDLSKDIVHEGFGFILIRTATRRVVFAHRGRDRHTFRAAPFHTEYALREIERLLLILREGCRDFTPGEWPENMKPRGKSKPRRKRR